MKLKTLLLATILITSFNHAQDYKFGKPKVEDFNLNISSIDSTNNAIILDKTRKTYFEFDTELGWVIITEIEKKVKILNKNGYDYSTEELFLYKSSKRKESVSNIKGFTHNLIAGEIITEKLKRNGIFKSESSENYNKVSFTLPNVKEGSIIEWRYKITSPYYKIDDLIIQEDIPTLNYFCKIRIPEYFKFNKTSRGLYNYVPKEYAQDRALRVRQGGGTYNYGSKVSGQSRDVKLIEKVTDYQFNDVGALKEEPYVSNLNNFRGRIIYELSSTQFPNTPFKNYATSWEEVISTINKSDNFGDQLNKKRHLKEVITTFNASSLDKVALINNAFNHIKENMTWNNKYGKYTRVGVQKAYKEKTGNVAEINLTLVTLLRELGFNANPVLVSTRQHGIPLFPTIEGFNYVIACVKLNDKEILMDATEKLSIPGILPIRVLNWEGTLVFPDGRHEKIRLYPNKRSQENAIMSINISSDGSVIGKRNSSFTDIEALEYREETKNMSEESYMEEKMNQYGLDDISNFSRKNFDKLQKPVIESYEFEIDQGVDMISGEMYFSPLFFLKLNTNPFKLEERKYPIDFSYPYRSKKIVNIKIPEGFEVKSIPEPIKMTLPDRLGTFLFNIKEVAGGLNVMSTLDINSAIIPATMYLDLKEFYKRRVAKETEQVILTKKLP